MKLSQNYARILFLSLIVISFSNKIFASDTISLEQCYVLAEESSPLRKNIEYRQRIAQSKIDNFSKDYWPQLNLNAKAQYQSEVTRIDIDIPIPNFNIKLPEMPKDQYQLAINIQQLLWDGGSISSLKNLELAQQNVDVKQTEIELYNIKDKVNNAYFNILILNERIKILIVLIETLEEKLKTVNSGVKAGFLLASNADVIRAEIMTINQTIFETVTAKKVFIEMLGKLIEKDLNEDIEFTIPDNVILKNRDFHSRLEYSAFELQKEALEQAKRLNKTKYMPKIFAFGQAMYAKPGLNMFSEKFEPAYIAGIQFSWNIWNWGKSHKEDETAELQKNMLITSEDNFTKQLNIAEKSYINNIEKLEGMIEQDKQLIEIRKKIAGESSKQLDAGVITSTDYITELNKQKQAELTLEVHKIELIKTKIEYITFTGNAK